MSETLSFAEFLVFREQLRGLLGLRLSDERYPRIAQIVAARMSELGVGFDRYGALLSSPSEGPAELSILATSVTIGETYFLRNRDHWRALEEHVLPRIRRRCEDTGERRIRVWSAGCSTGEEAYTAAMVLDRCIPDRSRWSIQLLGTDINPAAIASAKESIYGRNSFRGVPPELVQRHFEPVDGGGHRPRAPLREMVRFQQANLLDASTLALIRGMDVVFCRNVLIYFDAEAIGSVLKNLHRALRPGGFLFLGHAETLPSGTGGFAPHQVCDTILYEVLSGEADDPSRLGPPPPPVPEAPEPSHDELRAGANEPDDAEALLETALLLAGQGDAAAAMGHCRRVLDEHPLSAEAHCTAALVHEGVGEDEEARAELERAVYLDDGFAIAHLRLACLHERTGRSRSARLAFENALEALGEDDEHRIELYSGGFDRAAVERLCKDRLAKGVPAPSARGQP